MQSIEKWGTGEWVGVLGPLAAFIVGLILMLKWLLLFGLIATVAGAVSIAVSYVLPNDFVALDVLPLLRVGGIIVAGIGICFLFAPLVMRKGNEKK